MVSPASTGTSQKEQTNPMTANPAANGSMSRASVSTQTSYPVFTSVSSAQPQPPRFAEDVYGSRRGQRFHHQAHRWHTSLIDIDDTPLLKSGSAVRSTPLLFVLSSRKQRNDWGYMALHGVSIYPF